MDPVSIGLALGGKFLDRIFSRKDQRSTDRYNDPAAIRRRYEEAGFNPLLGIANANPNRQIAPAETGFSHAFQALLSARHTEQQLEIERDALETQERLAQRQMEQRAVARSLSPAVAPTEFDPFRAVEMYDITDSTGRELRVVELASGERQYTDLRSGTLVEPTQMVFGLFEGEQDQPVEIRTGQAFSPEVLEMDGALAGVANITAAFGDGVISSISGGPGWVSSAWNGLWNSGPSDPDPYSDTDRDVHIETLRGLGVDTSTIPGLN